MNSGRGSIQDVVVVRCDRGDDLLTCLEEAVEEHRIHQGLILGGYGTLDRSRVHMVTTTGFPVEEYFDDREEPLEVLSMDGLVVAGAIHAHIVVSDTDQAYGGHLEPGCRVLYLCEVVIGVLEGLEMRRVENEDGLNLLHFEREG